MGSLVGEQSGAGCRALCEPDQELALHAMERDRDVDGFDTLIDKDCQSLFFVVTQPLAVDLRLLTAALKINSQLERIGDSALEAAAHSMIFSRHLERIVDHATGISEEVMFLVKAKLVKRN